MQMPLWGKGTGQAAAGQLPYASRGNAGLDQVQRVFSQPCVLHKAPPAENEAKLME